jgi:hypothetical protein
MSDINTTHNLTQRQINKLQKSRTIVSCTYDKTTKTITRTETINSNLELPIQVITKVDLSLNTISTQTTNMKYGIDGSIQTSAFGIPNIYTFRAIINELKTNDELTVDLLANQWYCQTYLGYKFSVGDLPSERGRLVFGVPSTLFPFRAVEHEFVNRPTYIAQLLFAYAKYNSLLSLNVELLLRLSIVIPGLIVSPVYYFLIGKALQNMN